MKEVKLNRLNDHLNFCYSRCEFNLPVASRKFILSRADKLKMNATQDNILRCIIPILCCPNIVYFFLSKSHIDLLLNVSESVNSEFKSVFFKNFINLTYRVL